MNEKLINVDHAILSTNQAFIISLNIIGFVFDAIWLSVLVTFVMLGGTLLKRPGFGFVYNKVFKPLGWVQPNVISDNPEPVVSENLIRNSYFPYYPLK